MFDDTSDYFITRDGVKEDTYPDQLTPPDISTIDIHANENFINSTISIDTNGNKLFDSSVQLEMVVSKPPFNQITSRTFPLSMNRTLPGGPISNVSIGVAIHTTTYSDDNITYSNSTSEHIHVYRMDVTSHLHDFDITDRDQFAVDFRAVDEELINGSHWKAEDSVAGILIPPPQYTFSAPQSLELKPGQEAFVKLGINSPVAVDSQVMVSTPSNPNLKADFMASKLTIPEKSTGYVTLRLKVPENGSRSNFFLPIIANVSFPLLQEFPERGIQLEPMIFNSSLAVSIVPTELPILSIPPGAYTPFHKVSENKLLCRETRLHVRFES